MTELKMIKKLRFLIINPTVLKIFLGKKYVQGILLKYSYLIQINANWIYLLSLKVMKDNYFPADVVLLITSDLQGNEKILANFTWIN